jgi:hypothetical protein
VVAKEPGVRMNIYLVGRSVRAYLSALACQASAGSGILGPLPAKSRTK